MPMLDSNRSTWRQDFDDVVRYPFLETTRFRSPRLSNLLLHFAPTYDAAILLSTSSELPKHSEFTVDTLHTLLHTLDVNELKMISRGVMIVLSRSCPPFFTVSP